MPYLVHAHLSTHLSRKNNKRVSYTILLIVADLGGRDAWNTPKMDVRFMNTPIITNTAAVEVAAFCLRQPYSFPRRSITYDTSIPGI